MLILLLFRCLSTSLSRWSLWKSGGKSQNIAQKSHGAVWSWGESTESDVGRRTGGRKEERTGKEAEEGKGKASTAETWNWVLAVCGSRWISSRPSAATFQGILLTSWAFCSSSNPDQARMGSVLGACWSPRRKLHPSWMGSSDSPHEWHLGHCCQITQK